jgi:hypothetical protein
MGISPPAPQVNQLEQKKEKRKFFKFLMGQKVIQHTAHFI